MHDPKALALTILRNKNSSRTVFRKAAFDISRMLVYETLRQCPVTSVQIETPERKTDGVAIDQKIILLPILRSGLTLLPAFLEYFEGAAIGTVGLKRDEKTAIAHWYYENLPAMDLTEKIIMLDPMIATGGTSLNVLTRLKEKGVQEKNIIFAAIIGSSEGIAAIKKTFPEITLIVAAQDPELTSTKFIVPGLGDFGDRFFGTK